MTQTVFHKTPPPWFTEQVAALGPGKRHRASDGQLISFNGKGWHLYDFREKSSEVYEPVMTLAQKLEVQRLMRESVQTAAASTSVPNKDGMYHPKDWPVAARVWLYKAGLNNDDIDNLEIFWSPTMRRVVVPYMTVAGQWVWIARRVHDASFKADPTDGPKYLFPYGVARGGGAMMYSSPDENAPRSTVGVVITEDILSAWRVSKDTDYDAVAAQGTSLDLTTLALLTQRYDNIVTWLDPDIYGQQGASRIRKDLGRMGVTARNVVSQVDPKLLPPDAIREALEV